MDDQDLPWLPQERLTIDFYRALRGVVLNEISTYGVERDDELT
jgi:hypothetical protein